MKPTTVISVRGRDRAELLKDPAFIYVGRQCAGWPGSIWGNPFKPKMDSFEAMRLFDRLVGNDRRQDSCLIIDGPLTVEDAIEWYEAYVKARRSLWNRLAELKGRILGCWCVDWPGVGEPVRPCHAVSLAKLADSLGATP